jgi:hypothetical protein
MFKNANVHLDIALKSYWMRDKNPYKNETPGPLHRIDDELKAPGSFALKS